MAIIPCFETDAVSMSSTLRTPHYAWKNWGVNYREHEFASLVEQSEAEYGKDSNLFTPESYTGTAIVNRAAEMAGLGNANGMLNRANAETVCAHVRNMSPNEDTIRILDIGAGSGNTTLAIVDELPPHILERTVFHLVEPAGAALEAAAERLQQRDAKYQAVNKPDTEFIAGCGPDSFHVVTAVAAIHHHAYLDPIFAELYRVLAPGGLLCFSDWHHRMHLHPRHAFALVQFSHSSGLISDADLNRFREVFPNVEEPCEDNETDEDKTAHKQIVEQCRNHIILSEKDPFLYEYYLEGVRPVENYLELMSGAGFKEILPVRKLLPGSSLLCVSAAIKT